MTVLLFGVTRDIVGNASLSIPVSKAGDLGTVGALKAYLKDIYPSLGELSSLAVAVNKSYAFDSDPVGQNDEIALIPPVSGG